MKTKIFSVVLVASILAVGLGDVPIAHAVLGKETIKLPYEKGEMFVVVQGYHSPPTHINKDIYAIDFSKNGCDAYGKAVVAASEGVVIMAEEVGYNGGYGTYVVVKNQNGAISRYAHLIPLSIPFNVEQPVSQGEIIGEVGNTGLVTGTACKAHPGTHLHFAMYTITPEKNFAPYLPEPISGYTNITEGRWYLSDNGPPQDGLTDLKSFLNQLAQIILGYLQIIIPGSTGSFATATGTNKLAKIASIGVVSSSPLAAIISGSFAGGVTVTPAAPAPAPTATASAPTSSDTTVSTMATTSTLATSTAPESTSTTIAITTSTLEGPLIIIQPIDTDTSRGSWYDDNWFDLGGGFYGTLRQISIKAATDKDHFRSHLWLDEYVDANYGKLNQTFLLSDDAPITNTLQTITIDGLRIPLQRNKYYRLRTYQDYQNRSVILAGTAATGTAMWDESIGGIGKVEHQYTFYPYLAMDLAPGYDTFAPPDQPPTATVAFDSLNSNISVSWQAGIASDTPTDLLAYEINISTSTSLSASWQLTGENGNKKSFAMPVAYPNSYTLGVRSVDQLDHTSPPLVVSWQFPPNYYLLPSQLDHSTAVVTSTKKLSLDATTTISAVAFWTSSQQGIWCCSESHLSLRTDSNGSPGLEVASSGPIDLNHGDPTPDEHVYYLNASSTLAAGDYWLSLEDGPFHLNPTTIYGNASGTIYFRIAQ